MLLQIGLKNLISIHWQGRRQRAEWVVLTGRMQSFMTYHKLGRIVHYKLETQKNLENHILNTVLEHPSLLALHPYSLETLNENRAFALFDLSK